MLALLAGHVHMPDFFEGSDIDPHGAAILQRAYESTRHELQQHHDVNHATLAELIDPITGALLDFYAVGQRDESQLVRYAVSRALVRLRGG
jgi:hypothetical protein